MGNTCIVVQPIYKKSSCKDVNYLYKMEEAVNLSKALDIEVISQQFIKLRNINPATFMSLGFLERLLSIIETEKIETLFINDTISAIQQRNLENKLKCKVIDRNALIIAIFGKRAQSKEGKLQSELAALMYQKSRLVKAWSHLERQRGGGGFIGGPGETQKELDKRMLATKIESLKKQLDKVKLNKSVQSASRKKKQYKTVALVGYTNAGKSALFNSLTNNNSFSKDLLFATLDPTLRIVNLGKKETIILLDTVGFISDLPHQLIEAFHSTLSEIQNADLILHVVDISNKEYLKQIEDVKNVLKEIHVQNKPYIEVYNKTDLLSVDERIVEEASLNSLNQDAVLISAKLSYNLEALKRKISYYINQDTILSKVIVDYDDIHVMKYLYNQTNVLSKKIIEDSSRFYIEFSANKGSITILSGYYNK